MSAAIPMPDRHPQLVFPSMPDDAAWRRADTATRRWLSEAWYRAQNAYDGPVELPDWSADGVDRQRASTRHHLGVLHLVRRLDAAEAEVSALRVVAEAGRGLARAWDRSAHLSATLLDDTEPIDMRKELRR